MYCKVHTSLERKEYTANVYGETKKKKKLLYIPCNADILADKANACLLPQLGSLGLSFMIQQLPVGSMPGQLYQFPYRYPSELLLLVYLWLIYGNIVYLSLPFSCNHMNF